MDLGSRRTRPAATQVANDYCNQHTNLLMRSFVLSLLIANTIAMATKVLVTGAGGKTGRIVLQKLLDRPGFEPTGVVRTETSKRNLVEFVPSSHNKLIVADIYDRVAMEKACQNMDALVICTSATPAPTGEMKDDRPVFGYPNGQPKQVDWMGQKNQIDAAKKAGVSQIVICSSMGGTNPENPLNKLGRNDDGSSGNILLWKRKAEKYLIDSGITYTIIHPGGLLDEEGGKREIVVGVDDEQVGTDNRSIPRADVAELLVSALEYDSYKNRSFDARSKPQGEGKVTTDYEALLKEMSRNCDYSLGEIPE